MNEVKESLIAAGFIKSSYYPWVEYTREDGVLFQIYLDPKKPNRVVCLRGCHLKTIIADGIIGNFVSGKGRMKRFSFSSPEKLIAKLNSIKVY